MEFIHNLFIKLATGYAELQNYSSQDAIKTFSSLQCPKFTNPWIQTQISKAYMDLGQNIQAEEILSQSIRKYPLFLDSMDIYSSILWQLGKNDELYELANNLADRHKKLPQTWCAMGNYFNSQQDHTRALKCFKRATLLDNRYALAYNLAGHEYIDIKETQLALQCFQTAVNINPRFYQAWFNIARIYLFSGKNELALAHLAKAISINPKHPILLQYVAECRARLQHFEEALHALQLATPMDPGNVMIRYKKARLLAKLGNLQAAKHELDIIAQNCTEGSDVYFTLAKICTIHGDHSQANLYFQEAIRQNPEIAPKVNRIQECINKDEPINWEDDDDDI
jgi:anaphase-promoting complex subunit 3